MNSLTTKMRLPYLSAWLNNHVVLASVIILTCSIVPRLLLTSMADPRDLITPDSYSYLSPAHSLLEHGSFLNSHKKPEAYRTPGYPLFIAGIMALVGEDTREQEGLRKVLITQAVILSWSVVILYWLARRILPAVMAFTGALLAAFLPWGAARAGYLMTEGFYALVLILLFYVMYLVVEHATKFPAILLGGGCIGLLTSAVVLVRPLSPLVLIVALALFLLRRDKGLKTWILVAVMLTCASTPLYLWKERNLREAQFDGISMTSGITAHVYFASSVKARFKGAAGDLASVKRAAYEEEATWDLPLQVMNDERWRRVRALIEQHPFLSLYSFASNMGAAVLAPDPSILKAPRLNFAGDFWALGVMWVAYLSFALIGVCSPQDKEREDCVIRKEWLLGLLGMCLLLTVPSGLSFYGGSRFRAPLDLMVPLLAGVGLVRVVKYFKRKSNHIYDLWLRQSR